jgi:hypothetical protein
VRSHRVVVSCFAVACGVGCGSSGVAAVQGDAGADAHVVGSRGHGDAARPGAPHDASIGDGDAARPGAPHDASIADAWMAPDVGTIVEAGSPGAVDITFNVSAAEKVQPISPYVYGVNDASRATAVHATIVRIGGNRLTAYNWENNASNSGSDDGNAFENDDYLCAAAATCAPNDDAPGAYLAAIVGPAAAAGAAVLVTVPIVDYVSADKSPSGDVRQSADYLTTRFKQNKPAKGAAFVDPPDTSDAFVYQDEMVHWLTTVGAPSATLRFQLDNEPDLWTSTHAEVHPLPVTYAEIAKRNIDYATAIKNVVPAAHVVGPVNYGWEGLVNLQSATDSATDGDFITWWLKTLQAAETTAGKRLVDGLDLHWYPEATGGGVRITDDGTSAAEVAAREQAPRSLWDTTYTETSWIAQTSTNGPIYLIPREQKLIADNYPGTKLSFSEWNYGGGTDISGAIASADVLGIFGAYGVDMAMMWPMNGDDAFTYAAYDAYRNYDGQGAAFGDTSVSATTTDVPDSSVYASVQSTDATKLVIVAINKATSSKVAGIVIAHSTQYVTAKVYTITAAGGAAVAPASGLTAVGTNAFRYTMPAQSVSVLVPAP